MNPYAIRGPLAHLDLRAIAIWQCAQERARRAYHHDTPGGRLRVWAGAAS